MRFRKYAAIWLALSVLIVGAHLAADQVLRSPSAKSTRSVWLPDKAQIKLIKAAGFGRITADVLWLSFIQYAGDTPARRADKWGLCDDYLNVITEVDPHFLQPYWFAAFIVGAEEGRPDLATRIIEQGIASNPGNWYLPYIAGINQFIYAKNDRLAGKYYELAASMPGAPKYIVEQAHIMQSGAPGLLSEARALESASQHAGNPLVKDKARRAALAKWQDVLLAAPNQAYKQAAKEAIARLQ
jgi:hypothetical protein